MVQWLRFSTTNAWRLGSIPGQRTRSHILQLKDSVCQQLKDPAFQNKTAGATTKTQCSQMNKSINLLKTDVSKVGEGFTKFTHRIGSLFVTAANESYPDEQNCHLLEVDVICIF